MKRTRNWLRPKSLWPLYIVLAVQIALTLRRIIGHAAIGDEALYRWGGWAQWQHWLHGAPISNMTAYFSGAPQIYSPLVWLTGSLLGARLLSLAFMLGATVLLWAFCQSFSSVKDPHSFLAIAGCGLFAILGPTSIVGSLATYDAMSLFFLALASFLGTQNKGKWLIGCVVALSLANATKYASILWDPFVIAIVIINAGWRRALAVAGGAFLSLATFLTAAGDVSGLIHTTFNRPAASNGAISILHDAFVWVGVLAILAVVGAVLAWRRVGRRRESDRVRWLMFSMALAVFAAPLEQARIHTLISLDKHVDFGAWFAAVPAGYAVVVCTQWALARMRSKKIFKVASWSACALLAGLMIFMGVIVTNTVPDKPVPASLLSALKQVIPQNSKSVVLIDDSTYTHSLIHMLPPISAEATWKVARSFTVGHGYNQGFVVQHYLSLIHDGRVKVVILSFRGALKRQDNQYLTALHTNKLYRFVEVIRLGRGRGNKLWIWRLSK